MDIYDIGLYVGYFLVVIGIIAAILLPLISSIGNPRSLMRSGIGVAIIFGIFLLSYLISDNEVGAKFVGDPFNVTPQSSQFIGGLLISSYFLFVIAFAGIFVTEISKAIK